MTLQPFATRLIASYLFYKLLSIYRLFKFTPPPKKPTSNMTTLPGLPLEIRQRIAACVKTVHPPSLFELSLVNRACYAATTFLVLRQIKVMVHNHERLRDDVDRLLRVLSHTGSTQHVRRIVIKGNMQLDAKKTYCDDYKPWWREHGLEEILEDEEPLEWGGRYVVYDKPVIEKGSEEDLAWTPVIQLLQTIHHLKDLIYDCKSQLPPSLLQMLQARHPLCRLHHLTFRFRTLSWGTPYPYEMELATSPSLYAVKVPCSRRDTDGEDDFNSEALMELTRIAPNLREVTVLSLQPMLANRHRRPRQLWQGLPGCTNKPLGHLISLSFKGDTDLENPRLLQDWARHTDFSYLQHLTLGGCWEEKSSGLTSETMEWIARTQSFSQLRTLRVYLTRNDMYNERPDYSKNAVLFFQSLGSLEELSVTGPIDSDILDAILSYHGQTLKKLALYPYEKAYDNYVGARVHREIPVEFTQDRLRQIQSECPLLEDLSIPIRRDKSSASETELYRCLGRIGNVRSLFLTLDCSNWHVSHDSTYNPQFDEVDEQLIDPSYTHLKKGFLRETYINSAIDESLARSIWDVISKHKTGKQLERLKLFTTGGGDYGGGGSSSNITDPIEHMSRSWLIERVVRDDRQGITVRELGKEAREVQDEFKRKYTLDAEPGRLFWDIWPHKEGSEHWQDDWSSFPLQV